MSQPHQPERFIRLKCEVLHMFGERADVHTLVACIVECKMIAITQRVLTRAKPSEPLRYRHSVIFGLKVLLALSLIAVLTVGFAALQFALIGEQMSSIELVGP